MSKKCGDPYENLANAIIVQATEDYRRALKALKRRCRDKDALAVKEECERFFQSGWFSVLTSVDGEWLMRKLKDEVKAG